MSASAVSSFGHDDGSQRANKHHAETRGEHQGHHARMVMDFRRRFWISLVLTVPTLLLSPLVQRALRLPTTLSFAGSSYVLFGFATVVYAYGGYPFLSGLYRELSHRKPGMMTLIAVAVTVAYTYSSAVVFGVPGKYFFWELVTLIDVMLLGHWIEMRSVMGASRALEALVRLQPSHAHRLTADGSVKDVSVRQLRPGDHVVVRPGEKIPVDGIVSQGASSVNEALLTGESNPVDKQVDSAVIGGSLNGDGSLTVEVNKTGEQSFLSQVITLTQQAQSSRSHTQDLANQAAFLLTIIALGSGTATLLAWRLLLAREFVFALERSVTVMVITCPHALGLAVPLVVAVSTALGTRHGLLIRERTAFERARSLDVIIFDKTGTLTEGRFGITDIVPLVQGCQEDDLLRMAAAVEAYSEHPIARAITEAVDRVPHAHDFRALPGQGAEARINGHHVRAVSPGYLASHDMPLNEARIAPLTEEGKTVVCILSDNEVVGMIGLSDVVRPESAPAIAALQHMGIQCYMLTGDQETVARRVSSQLGLDDCFAQVLPGAKADRITQVQDRGLTVGMVGDGINDAPALAQADVGIAIGAGTDVAAETADVILVRSNPKDVVAVVQLARVTYRKMLQNLFWATGYNVVAIPLAAGVLAGAGIVLSPAVGAVLMSLSTVIVAFNARLLRLTE